MVFVVGYGVACIAAMIAYLLSRDKSRNSKYKIWGIALMVPISESLSFAIGLTYATIVKNGWAGLIMWYIFPIIFIIGLMMLTVGILKKEKAENL
ncbi:hypothetical protein [Virgibacillus salexigens]|uniref:hypothetical protein n=1 Tax=Virgibacillus salexigens TaxID=61016 RepID=UPI0030815F6D